MTETETLMLKLEENEVLFPLVRYPPGHRQARAIYRDDNGDFYEEFERCPGVRRYTLLREPCERLIKSRYLIVEGDGLCTVSENVGSFMRYFELYLGPRLWALYLAKREQIRLPPMVHRRVDLRRKAKD